MKKNLLSMLLLAAPAIAQNTAGQTGIKDALIKHWKITEEDWRNRRKWEEHNAAAEEMFENTETRFSGWTILEANFKWYARLKFLKTAIRALESLGLKV